MFALLNLAMADGAIACWNAKYHFEFWRPIKAIPFMASDDNPQRFSDALAEIHNARVWGGIHFRSACHDGSIMGQAVGDLVLQTALRPLAHDDEEEEDGHGGDDHR